MGKRKILVILDDLWTAQDIFPYQIGQYRSLLTTRQPGLANTLCDAVYRPRPLTHAQAFHLLTHDLPSALVQENREILRALSQQVGYLPLVLEQIGKYVRREACSHSHRRIQEALAQLFHPTSYLKLQMLPNVCSLYDSLKRSEQYLPESSRHALSVIAAHFPAMPATFSERQVADLFQTHRQYQLRDLDDLVDGGLLQGAGRNQYQLHPVVAAYVRLAASSADEPNG